MRQPPRSPAPVSTSSHPPMPFCRLKHSAGAWRAHVGLTLPPRGPSVSGAKISCGGDAMTSFTITPLTGHTGAEVVGLDFTQPIDGETRDTLNKAFAEH